MDSKQLEALAGFVRAMNEFISELAEIEITFTAEITIGDSDQVYKAETSNDGTFYLVPVG